MHKKNHKWCRNKNERRLMGVCQGLADYFHIPVEIIRLSFILSAIFGGWGIFIYILLCFSPVTEENETPILTYTSQKSSIRVSLTKYVQLIFFALCCGVVYLPLLVLLILIFGVTAASFFYPVLYISGYFLSLRDFGTLGFLTGGGIAILVLASAYLLTLGVLYFHLHYHHLKKALWRTAALYCLFLSLNSAALLAIFYSPFAIEQGRSWKVEGKEIEWQTWQEHIQNLEVLVNSFKIVSHAKENIHVHYFLDAKGATKNEVNSFLREWQIELSDISRPKWLKVPSDIQRFLPKINIIVFVPNHSKLSLSEIQYPLEITGQFSHLHLGTTQQHLYLDRVSIQHLDLHGKDARIYMDRCTGGNLLIQIENSQLLTKSISFEESNISLQGSRLNMNYARGNTNLYAKNSKVFFECAQISKKFHLEAKHSHIYLEFEHVPSLRVAQNIRSRILNKSKSESDENAGLILNLEKSYVEITELTD